MLTALINGTIFTGKEEFDGKAVLISDENIEGIVGNGSIPAEAKVVDCEGKYIAPGLIDLQIYGGGGVLFSSRPSVEALKAMTEGIVKTGTTSYLLTLATNSMEIFREAIRDVKAWSHPALGGIHFEGPYLNPIKRGAHVPEFIKRPELQEVEALIAEGDGHIKMITLAPEITGPEVIKFLSEQGVIISAGHSNATFSEGMEGFERGIKTATHLFNAMSPLHHRDTGLPGAIFASDKAFASIVADGIHVNFQMVGLSKMMMEDRLFLITDAVEEVLEGPYQHVEQADCYTLPDGTLSGSKLTLLKAVENCVRHVGIPLGESLRMASTYPARVIGYDNKGVLEKGYQADLIIFDHSFHLSQVYLKGAPQL